MAKVEARELSPEGRRRADRFNEREVTISEKRQALQSQMRRVVEEDETGSRRGTEILNERVIGEDCERVVNFNCRGVRESVGVN